MLKKCYLTGFFLFMLSYFVTMHTFYKRYINNIDLLWFIVNLFNKLFLLEVFFL